MARDEAYQKAEKKIEQALRSRTTELDLSGYYGLGRLKLTELPDSLRQLTQLRSLNLSHNQLTALPEWLGELTQLQSLNFLSNELTSLPESLINLKMLRILELPSNQLNPLPKIIFELTWLNKLNISGNKLSTLPPEIGRLVNLTKLEAASNELSSLPIEIIQISKLVDLNLGTGYGGGNHFTKIPRQVFGLRQLSNLGFGNCKISEISQDIGQLKNLERLELWGNSITNLPPALAQLEHLKELRVDSNPLNLELDVAYEEGFESVMAYLRAKAGEQITLNEAKLILIGEGDVGKTCLIDALQGTRWQEHDTTHGIEIRSVQVVDPDIGTEIALNCWDFGGQRVYRPTHQLFFSAPAVYLVVWKPREGLQQGFVKEWIKLIKHREPDAKILVVATHGGPQERQPDINLQELWNLFGKDTVLGFFHVDSKPDENGKRRGIAELKQAIARIAADLPEMGRSVPKRWQDVREALAQTEEAYLSLERVLELCREQQMDDDDARLFVTIEHRLGHFIHYEHDLALRDIVVLRPDWLATAISFVLDDRATREAHGLVPISRLSQLWNDPTREAEFRYPAHLHRIFLGLMEHFDLSYRVDDIASKDDTDSASLIAQLVPDTRPEEDLAREWPPTVASGDTEQMQICRIVDEKGQSATGEGLFYQLIVRLHKYSLGRINHSDSIHWQRGLVLDADYNGRALLEHIGDDVRITVRAPYAERFLTMLTEEVKYLVKSLWKGLHCNVMVPCIKPCGKHAPGTGLFEVEKLIDSKRQKRDEYPCPVCNEWQNIDQLLRNAPSEQPVALEALFAEFAEVKQQLTHQGEEMMGRFDNLDDNDRRILSQIDGAYTNLLQVLTDEAKEGPRLFSFIPVGQSNFDPRRWVRDKFRLTLWCEHSRLPLPVLNGADSKEGVYEIELTREWLKKAAPYLKLLTGTLSLVLPVASAGIKLALDDKAYKAIEEQLDFGQKLITATIGEGAKVGEFMGPADETKLEHGENRPAQGAVLREFHALLKAKDPGSRFGGLVRVMNKRNEFLWVHPQFEGEY